MYENMEEYCKNFYFTRNEKEDIGGTYDINNNKDIEGKEYYRKLKDKTCLKLGYAHDGEHTGMFWENKGKKGYFVEDIENNNYFPYKAEMIMDYSIKYLEQMDKVDDELIENTLRLEPHIWKKKTNSFVDIDEYKSLNLDPGYQLGEMMGCELVKFKNEIYLNFDYLSDRATLNTSDLYKRDGENYIKKYGDEIVENIKNNISDAFDEWDENYEINDGEIKEFLEHVGAYLDRGERDFIKIMDKMNVEKMDCYYYTNDGKELDLKDRVYIGEVKNGKLEKYKCNNSNGIDTYVLARTGKRNNKELKEYFCFPKNFNKYSARYFLKRWDEYKSKERGKEENKKRKTGR